MKKENLKAQEGNIASLRRQRITADKREIKDFLKLPSATSFIRKTLGEMQTLGLNIIKTRNKFL